MPPSRILSSGSVLLLVAATISKAAAETVR
jgi:hypothetical protein